MAKRVQKRQVKQSKTAASVCWFDVPADDLGRARHFIGHYSAGSLRGCQQPLPSTGTSIQVERMLLRTVDSCLACIPDTPSRSTWPFHRLTRQWRRSKSWAAVCKPKTAVPHMGYFAICEDTEHNTFALWEMNERAA